MVGPSPNLLRSAARARGTSYDNVTVVTGPPLAGKTSHVHRHRAPGDLVIDWDALAQALGSPVTHGHNPALRPFIASARDAVYERLRRGYPGRAWIISSDHAHAHAWPGATHVRLDIDRAEAHRRADADGRPAAYHAVIDDWYDRATVQPRPSRAW